MRIFFHTSCLVVLTALACNGTETQNPISGGALVSFGNSGCKKETLANAFQTLQNVPLTDAGVLNYGDEVAGLKCFAWQTTGADALRISLINFEEACGAEWVGSANVASDGVLTLGLNNPQCLIASCGWCIYDWSFEVKGVNLARDLPVTVNIDTCPGEQDVKVTSAQLPLATQSSGILCRYANFNAVGWQAMSLGTCGQAGMPCTATNMCQASGGSTAQTCQGDLTCADNGTASEMICTKPCAVDSDCGSTGAQSCQTGLCRPQTAW
jgi:hypothetical protein